MIGRIYFFQILIPIQFGIGFRFHFSFQTSALGVNHKPGVLTGFGVDCTDQKPMQRSPSLSQFAVATE